MDQTDTDATTPDEFEPDPLEVVDGLPVLASDTTLAEAQAPASLVPARQAAALAATGFLAGAATVALVHRRQAKVSMKRGRRKKPRLAIGEVVTSNSFLVDVHLLRRD